MPTFRPVTFRRATAAALTTVMLLTLVPAATFGAKQPPNEVKQAEKHVLAMVNTYRTNRGLAPLRMDYHVRQVARARSRDMRDRDYLSHGSPSGQSAGTMMHARGVKHWGWGENIGRLSYLGWGVSNRGMVEGWKHSPSHNRLLLSRDYNYVGVGIARNGYEAYYTLVFVRQPDHTPPKSGMSASGSGIAVSSGPGNARTVTVRWWGKDRPLQKYTAGLRGFTVQKRTPSGWRTLRHLTTTRSLTMRLSQGSHKFRVRAIDRRGNVGDWRRPLEVLVR